MEWKYIASPGGANDFTIEWIFKKPFKEACYWAFSSAIRNTSKDGDYRGYLREKPSPTKALLTGWGNNSYVLLAIGY